MVAYLEKTEGSEGFHQIIDFLTASHINYALTESLTIYASLIEQFWQTTALSTIEDGVMEITATIDGRVKTITEASIRRHLKLEDPVGISTLPTTEIFEQLALMGYDQGEGPTISIVSHHTPINGPSSSQPPSTPPSTASSIQTTPVAEEAAPMPYYLPLPRDHLLGSDEGSLSLNELTVLYTSLSKKVESLESKLKQTKQTYSTTLIKLIKKVKKLEQTIKTSQSRRRAKVVISDAGKDEEDPSKQGRSLIEELDMDARISLVPPHVVNQGRFDDTKVSDQPEEQLGVFSATKVLTDAAEQKRDVENVQTYTRRIRAVSTGSGGVSTASESVSTAGVKVKDKGKAVMQESEPPKKIKKRVQVQICIDEELAQKVHEEEQARFNAEQEAKFKAEQEQERLDHETAMKIQEELDASERQRMAQVHQAAQGFTDDEWDDILARVSVDKDFKLFAQQRAEAKRNKPMTPPQQKGYMSTYIKNQEGGYTLKQLKALPFEEVKEIFKASMRKVQSFMPMDSELEVQRLKRPGQDVVEEPSKRQRTGEASGPVQEQTCEEPKKIIRVGGHTEAYQTFDDMLKKFNRDDLAKIWNLVKERFKTTEPTEDKARELWVELKRLFELDDNDTLWKLQRYMHDPLNWWLYDTCGVHHVSIERGHDIYMLVEKDYPLTKALATLMLCNKLRLDQYSDMVDELLQKINIIANRPR
ncbi:hypothetical protein Tco_0860152 [Tanacetum coccineum]|uniref:Uncharacterized protein n=1 Tax=Tanacetum coccineum TaxID=301880 RepID=A0ABQ5BE36_9ASTR